MEQVIAYPIDSKNPLVEIRKLAKMAFRLCSYAAKGIFSLIEIVFSVLFHRSEIDERISETKNKYRMNSHQLF